MVISRPLEGGDLTPLTLSLLADEHHTSTTVEFFQDPRTLSNVYEDERGPVLIVRGSKALRLDIQFLDNNDAERNRTVMLEGFPQLAERAKQNGFTEIIFNTSSPLLKHFCTRRLGFREVDGDELRKLL